MICENKRFSLWISTMPCPDENSTEEYKQQYEDSFMYLGSSGSYPQNMTYNISTVGILGLPTDTAMIMDGAGGAVMQISTSAKRVNPDDGSMTIPSKYYNEAFIEKLTEMRCGIQMMHNAYILRIYNIQIRNGSKSSALESVREELCKPKEMPVYIESFNINVDMEEPNNISVDINLIQRNRKAGFND